MSLKTIRCRLIAPDPTRQELWQLMAEKNTPMLNCVLALVANHPDFDTWRQRGKLPATTVKTYINALKQNPQFAGQPCWFYISTENEINRIFKSWLALQKRAQAKVNGKERWLSVLYSDAELAARASCTVTNLRCRASQIHEQGLNFQALLALYATAQSPQDQAAIAYLLKRRGNLNPEEEDLTQLARKRRKAEIFIQRLKKQIQASIPQGRDLTGSQQKAALDDCSQTAITTDEEYAAWHIQLTTKVAPVPFPITFNTCESLQWSRTDSGRIGVKFTGLGRLSFDIYCDKPHLHWFTRFLEDQQTKKSSGNRHSAALFTLRSATLLWTSDKSTSLKGNPWKIHHLELRCTVDTRLWTAEGTEQVRQEKATELVRTITTLDSKSILTPNQAIFRQRKQTTLNRFQEAFLRPCRTLYQGNPDIVVGVSMGVDKPATLAVINVNTQEVLAIRSTRQLLGKDYPLLRRCQKHQERTSHQAHTAQIQHRPYGRKSSNLRAQVDHLLACAIIKIAQQYKASSIVIPDLKHIRDIVESEIKERAEKKFPDYLDGQKQYAKNYRKSIHTWSYSRLCKCIQTKAEVAGVSIEVESQDTVGNPREKARNLAEKAYTNRTNIA